MQQAQDNGLLDLFVEYTGNHSPGCDPTKGMGYFDGNTVTALWEYAQHYFTLNDNSFTTSFGASHIGAVNLVSGQTHGAVPPQPGILDGTLLGSVEPTFDDCPVSDPSVEMTGKNIGDLLNGRHVSWGFFRDGFKPTDRLPDGTAVCNKAATNKYGYTDTVYDSGNEPFQYYRSTANPHHLPPTSVAMTGPGLCGTKPPVLGGYQARCGYGPRLPFLVISPWSRPNFVDLTLTDQTSVIRFIEDNWGLGRIGDGSFDELAGPITNMFDFTHRHAGRLFLDRETGLPVDEQAEQQ
jgi:phospholipase C